MRRLDPICRCIFNVLSYIKFTLALQNCPKTKTPEYGDSYKSLVRTCLKTVFCRSYYNFKRQEKTANATVSVGTLTFFKNLLGSFKDIFLRVLKWILRFWDKFAVVSKVQ